MIRSILIILFCFSLVQPAFSQLAQFKNGDNIVVFKVKKSFLNKDGRFNDSILQSIFDESGGTIKPLFPTKRAVDKSGQIEIDLTTIYGFQIAENQEISRVINQLRNQKEIIYAEQLVIPELTYTPTDVFLSRQYQLSIIKAFQAWDVEKGDSSVVIAITDTGIDLDHEDLEINIAYNYNDPINGIDDDNDGYVDNFRGWDTGDNDNDPATFSSDHGNNVAGLAAAKTDNTTGIAGTGFNCRFVPIKIDTDLGGRLIGAYDAIIYAADQNIDIINCSWGSYTFANLGNDIINYATAKGSLVVAAVGNDGRDVPFYPAAYKNALAVGMTDSADVIRDNSNYGVHLDIMAVGLGMYTTSNNNQYKYNGGTSMASPLVAGAAAIVKSKYPNFGPIQIIEHMRNTSDDISERQGRKYDGKIGAGRLNMFRSVSDNIKPGVRMEVASIRDNNDSIFSVGDTLQFLIRFKNYLASADNLKAKISSPSNSLIFLENEFNLGTLSTLEEKTNGTGTFKAIVRKAGDFNELTPVKVVITNDNYRRESWFFTTINQNFFTVSNNTIATTLSSNGRIGHHEISTNQGVGFIYNTINSVLYEGSLIIGNSLGIDDGFRSNPGETDNDFISLQNVKKIPAEKADQEFEGIIASKTNPYKVSHKSYLFNDSTRSNYIIHAYQLKARENLNQYYVGLLIDWDILDFSKNQTGFDPIRELAYSYSTQLKSPFYATQLLSHNNAISFGIDNISGGNNGIDLGDGFSNQEKFMSISTRNEFAGFTTSDGNDILQTISYGPFNLEKDSTIVVAFAVLAADSLPALETVANNAKQNYSMLKLNEFTVNREFPTATLFSSNVYPNPAIDRFRIEVNLNYADNIEITLHNSFGQEVFRNSYNGFEGLNLIALNAQIARQGVYFLTIKTNGKEKLHKIVLQY